jgi:hypothetical protein
MKKFAILTSVLALTACGGGDKVTGLQGAPGKSAYEIWLEQGNTGTEQDFLDSLMGGQTSEQNSEPDSEQNSEPDDNIQPHYASLRELMQASGDARITQMSWPEHGGYYQIETSYSSADDNPVSVDDAVITNYVYKEKELNLANYGVYFSQRARQPEFGMNSTTDYYVGSWINNRNGIGENVYNPTENTVFSGSTMAYLNDSYYTSSNSEPVFIKGDAEYTHSTTNPKLVLDFDNYYTITLQNGYGTVVSGTNNTGNNRFDINTGTNIILENDVPTTDQEIGFVRQNSVEEVVGKYNVHFYEGSYEGWAPNGQFYLDGAFGGTKQ